MLAIIWKLLSSAVRGRVTLSGVVWRGAQGLGCGALLASCASPNLYTTPRSLPPRHSVGVVAPQLLHVPNERVELTDRSSPYYNVLLAGRVGITHGVDIGGRTNFSSVGFDAKWNAIRSPRFDLALDAGLELLPTTVYVDLPILMGFNLSEAISILPSTGLTLGSGYQPAPARGNTWVDTREADLPVAGRSFVRAGLGAQFRITPRFAVQPEATYLLRTKRGTETSDFMSVGLGFCFGPQPY